MFNIRVETIFKQQRPNGKKKKLCFHVLTNHDTIVRAAGLQPRVVECRQLEFPSHSRLGV